MSMRSLPYPCLPRSHIDTTGVQALIDTRNEIERWADRPVEVSYHFQNLVHHELLMGLKFHFASILSPWIRRSLIAAGFGTGSADFYLRHEIAPVTRYHDQFISDPQHSEERHSEGGEILKTEDPEVAVVVRSTSSRSTSSNKTLDEGAEDGTGTLVPSVTPFFHFDLSAAVKAAEHGVRKS